MKSKIKLQTKSRPGKKAAGRKKEGARAKEVFSRQDSSLLAIQSILVPTDFSPASEKAIAYAVPLARLSGAKLTLVHVIEPVATTDFGGTFPLAMENDEVKRACKRHLQCLVDTLEIEPKLIEKLLVRNGRAFNEIASAARTLKADLIIISTHGRTGLKHALLGSTTERVVQYAPCPVLVVRPQEREFLQWKTAGK